jgi:hypothetical protein
MSNKASRADNQQERLRIEGWITGFTDGEGCFTVSIIKNRNVKNGKRWQVFPEFVVTQSESSIQSLELFKKYFQCGYINRNKRKDGRKEDLLRYCVRSLDDLRNIIIPFFEANQLQTYKKNDFLIFKKIILYMSQGKHLRKNGLIKVIGFMSQMNSRRKNPKFLKSSETIRQILASKKRNEKK